MDIEKIEKEILTELQADERIDATDIDIEVENNGTAILSGSVPTTDMREVAHEDARLAKGVDSVVNQLTTTHAYDETIPSDEQISTNITKTPLWNDILIDETDIEFEVEGGVVTLKGETDALWKEIEIEEIIANLSGVENVINEISVVPKHNPEDAKLGKAIMEALEKDNIIDPDDVDIIIDEGKIEVSGVVKKKTKEEIIELVRNTHGVKKIDDQLVVEKTNLN